MTNRCQVEPLDLGFILETVPEYAADAEAKSPNPFKVTETVCIILFTMEITLKLLCRPMVRSCASCGAS